MPMDNRSAGSSITASIHLLLAGFMQNLLKVSAKLLRCRNHKASNSGNKRLEEREKKNLNSYGRK
ncbi:hypothetical protein E2542_SST30756 [Spatholobus suberectus]|nr:hypothetical protein E2542_SST30756 [Spatholobus suberectus]